MAAAKLLKDGTVLTFDDMTQSVKVLSPASVLVIGDRIMAIEENVEDMPSSFVTDAEIIDVRGKIVCPGFVNTHIHSWQTVYRTLGPNVTLSQYFYGFSQNSPSIHAFGDEDIYISSLEGYLEGLNAGVTSFVEHAHMNWNERVMEAGYSAAIDSAARIWWCYDVAQQEHFSADDQWAALQRISARVESSAKVLLGLSLDSLAASGKLNELLEKAQELNAQAFTVHCLGGPWPTGDVTSPANLCSQQSLHRTGTPIIFSHAPFLTEEDIHALRAEDLFVSITPEAEFHYGHGQTTGHLISDQAALGIDTTWTFSGDLLNQARLWLQAVRNTSYTKTLQAGSIPKHCPMTVEQAFLLATRQGGRALRRHDIGVIQVGAKADIAVFNGDSPNMLGWKDAVAAVMLHANVGDIEHVLVDGQFCKRDFKLIVNDTDRIQGGWVGVQKRFVEAAHRIQPQIKQLPELPEKLWGVAEFGDVNTATTIPTT